MPERKNTSCLVRSNPLKTESVPREPLGPIQCTSSGDAQEIKAFHRGFRIIFPLKGKNQKRGGRKRENKQKKKEEAALYITAYCIIYKGNQK